jgi:hypothetical protein
VLAFVKCSCKRTPTTYFSYSKSLWDLEWNTIFRLCLYYSFISMSMNVFMSVDPSRSGLCGYTPQCGWQSFSDKSVDGVPVSSCRSLLPRLAPSLNFPWTQPVHVSLSLFFTFFFHLAWWRISESNRWPPACKAGALASWANPPCIQLSIDICQLTILVLVRL